MAIEKTINFTLEVLAPADLFCEVSPIYLAVRKGNPAVFTITLTSLNGFAGDVALTASGAAPVTFGENPVNLTDGESTLVPMTIDTTNVNIGQVPMQLIISGVEA